MANSRQRGTRPTRGPFPFSEAAGWLFEPQGEPDQGRATGHQAICAAIERLAFRWRGRRYRPGRALRASRGRPSRKGGGEGAAAGPCHDAPGRGPALSPRGGGVARQWQMQAPNPLRRMRSA
jgi:hypothetical protein